MANKLDTEKFKCVSLGETNCGDILLSIMLEDGFHWVVISPDYALQLALHMIMMVNNTENRKKEKS